MGAVWYRARRGLRRGIASTVLLIVFVGITGGVVLAAMAGAERARNAVPGFLDYNRLPNIGIFLDPTLSPDEQNALADELLALPQWEAVGAVSQPVLTMPPEGGVDKPRGVVANAVVGGPYERTVDRPILVAGRLGDPARADEVTINEAFADATGLGVGDQFTVRTVTTGHLDAVVTDDFAADPDGQDVRLTVTGIERQPQDLTYDVLAQQDTLFAVRRYHLELTQAFWERYGGDAASYNTGLLGRVAPGDASDLEAAARQAGGNHVFVSHDDPRLVAVGDTRHGIDFEATALDVFALVIAVAGIALVVPALGRRVALDQVDQLELRAIGLRRAQRVAEPLLRASLVAVAGAAVAMGLAVALSPLTPIGLARQAEVHLGLQLDIGVLAIGGVAIAAGVLARCWFTADRLARARPAGDRPPGGGRPSRFVRRLAEAGAPVSAVAGVRMALERGRGRTAVPVASALAATTVGVATVVAALVFSASLSQAVTSPPERGWSWDVAVGAFSESATSRAGRAVLAQDPAVAAFQGFASSDQARIDDVGVNLAGLGPGDPEVGPTVLEGRLPSADEEIAVGPATLEQTGKQVGDEVRMSGNGTVNARIVGVVVPPAVLDAQVTLRKGAVMTLRGYRTVLSGDPNDQENVGEQYLVQFKDRVDRHAAMARLEDAFPGTVLTATVPGELENLRRVQRLPALVAGFVALLALGTLANALVTAIRRRRRDLALLKTLGLGRRQLAATVAWQATTFSAVAVIVGLPVGVALGRVVWRMVIDPIAANLDAVVPAATLLAVGVATPLAANLVAALPARAAARTRPAEAFRAE